MQHMHIYMLIDDSESGGNVHWWFKALVDMLKCPWAGPSSSMVCVLVTCDLLNVRCKMSVQWLLLHVICCLHFFAALL